MSSKSFSRFGSFKAFLPIFILGGVLVGCNQGTDVSTQPTQAELQQAAQRRTASLDDRKDLSPAQRAALQKYYSGGKQVDRGGAPK